MKLPFRYEGTLVAHLGIEFKLLSKDRMVLTMPVDERTMQYEGALHGGASLTLAETAAGIGTWMNLDPDKQTVVALEINANHIRAAGTGIVTATALPCHIGRTTAVWEVRITDEKEKLICVSRCTLAIVDKK
jgi:1,4-dihydroxy-2-naphthoyl-CoA hydrolase